MIDRRFYDKPVQFEISLGNAGNTIDGHIPSNAQQQGHQGAVAGQGPGKVEDAETGSIAGYDDGKFIQRTSFIEQIFGQ